jgi:hypothetical protein
MVDGRSLGTSAGDGVSDDEENILGAGGTWGDADFSPPAIIAPMIGVITAASRATTDGTTIAGFCHHGLFDELNTPHFTRLRP